MRFKLNLLICLILTLGSASATAATPKSINAAVEKGVAHLLEIQRNGNWETVATPDLSTEAEGSITGSQFSGPTAIATYALLCGGRSSSDPQIAAGIKFLVQTDPHGVYAAGFRCLVWGRIVLDKETRPAAKRDFNYLINAMHRSGPSRGAFGYRAMPGIPGNPIYDQSVSQIAVLGLWSLSRAGFEVETSEWRLMDSAWRAHQYADGSWPYYDSPKASWNQHTVSMTAAGVASLFITDQTLANHTNCEGNPADPNIDKGLAWLADNFDSVFQPIREGAHAEPYALFGLSRIGAASGYKRIGQVDWFARASDYLCLSQQANGSWSTNTLCDAAGTSLGVLCLSYGRAPVLINKLQYQMEGQKPGATAHWNQRPQDCFNFVSWLGTSLETRLNWQIVSLKASPEELQSAPILFISGNELLRFNAQDKAALRRYVEQGGLILGNADCASAPFIKSFGELASELFPGYEMRELPAAHPIYVAQEFPAKKWKITNPLRGVTNGVRELMLLPAMDLSLSFQRQDDKSATEQYQLASDIVLYAVDRSGLRENGQSYVVTEDPSAPVEKTVKVARLQYNGNWDPEPGGWRQLTAVMHNEYKTQLVVQPLNPGEGKLRGLKIAHLTGSVPFKLDESARTELKQFIADGGTLCVDAAGGSTRFAGSAETELVALFGDAAREAFNSPLPMDHPVFNVPAAPIHSVGYRSFARQHLAGSMNAARLCGIVQNGRVVVFYSREDLSGGLVGQPVDGILGYDPESASAIMRNIILYASRDQK